MRGIPKLSFAALAGVLCCSGATTPTTQTGDSHVPTSASGPASGRPAGAPRGHVSEEEALQAAPRSAARQARLRSWSARPTSPRNARSTRRPPRPRATRCWICATTGRRTSLPSRPTPAGSRCPTAIGASSWGWRTISWTRTASRWSRGQRTIWSCTASRRRCPCCARASSISEQHPCHDQESVEALEAVETVTYVPPRTCERTRRSWGACARSWRRPRRKAKVQTLDELVERQPAMAPKVKLLARRAAEKPAMAAVEQRLTCEGLLAPAAKANT